MINVDTVTLFSTIGLVIAIVDFFYSSVILAHHDDDGSFLFLIFIPLFLGLNFLLSLASGPGFWAEDMTLFKFIFYLRLVIFAIQIMIHSVLYISKQVEAQEKAGQKERQTVKTETDQRVKQIERRVKEKVDKKALEILLGKIKEKSGSLIAVVDEEMVELINSLRKKATETINQTNGRKISSEQAIEALEEILSDLITINDLVNTDSNQVTYFDLLGVSVNAGAEEIKKAYRDIMKIIHPDVARRNGADIDKANSLAEIVNAAYADLIKK